MPFTKEELEEMARADAEIEENFQVTAEDIRISRNIDLINKGPDAEKRAAKAREHAKAYYYRNREKVLEKVRAKRREDPEAARQYYRENYWKNRERIRAQQKEYSRRYREKNREMLREKNRARRESLRAQ